LIGFAWQGPPRSRRAADSSCGALRGMLPVAAAGRWAAPAPCLRSAAPALGAGLEGGPRPGFPRTSSSMSEPSSSPTVTAPSSLCTISPSLAAGRGVGGRGERVSARGRRCRGGGGRARNAAAAPGHHAARQAPGCGPRALAGHPGRSFTPQWASSCAPQIGLATERPRSAGLPAAAAAPLLYKFIRVHVMWVHGRHGRPKQARSLLGRTPQPLLSVHLRLSPDSVQKSEPGLAPAPFWLRHSQGRCRVKRGQHPTTSAVGLRVGEWIEFPPALPVKGARRG
jgi:hypothetical protein